MSGTNQYIAMIASVAVSVQFIYLKNVHLYYAIFYGTISVGGAIIGILSVNTYTKRKGKQSVILYMLVIVLVLALLAVPLKELIDYLDEKHQ